MDACRVRDLQDNLSETFDDVEAADTIDTDVKWDYNKCNWKWYSLVKTTLCLTEVLPELPGEVAAASKLDVTGHALRAPFCLPAVHEEEA